MTPGHLSIHDVAPETLGQVERILYTLKKWGGARVMLLVIPGLGWQERDLETLRMWASDGHVLAGHGWIHRGAARTTLYHRLHGALISRDVAEHLSRKEEEIATLMTENHAWFARQGLPPPTHYVPPAWALGRMSRKRLAGLPFDTVEVLRGVIDTSTGVLHRMPLLGYEADTPFRAWFLRRFNRHNVKAARRTGRCIRMSIHPQDLDLLLKDRIGSDCAEFRMSAEIRLPSAHA